MSPEQPSLAVAAVDGGERVPRLPRWTRQEILVLIQGKRVAESLSRRRRTDLGPGQAAAEPKWAAVSSYCRRNGVNRGPVQCRKRWSNLAGDYKRIRDWESEVGDGSDSYWVTRNDLRRERKLPGFFDREVYDILAGAPAPPSPDGGGSPDEAAPAVVPGPAPVSEKQYQPIPGPSQAQTGPTPPQDQGTSTEKQPEQESDPASQDGRKRKQTATTDGEDEPASLQSQLIDTMERNGKILRAQLEAHNTNLQLEREQRRDHDRSIVEVLNKLADALVRIADKL